MELILASASLRRQQMLGDLGVAFQISAPDIDESRLRGEPAAHYVERLACRKGADVAVRMGYLKPADKQSKSSKASLAQRMELADNRDWAILAADTIVVHGSLVLGKPTSHDDAVRMLRKLSGRTHEVITGFSWYGCRKEKQRFHVGQVRTKVTFADMPAEFWKWYVSTGEPMDKAGAYAAQGIGLAFIEKVSGSYSNVIGLPLPQVLEAYAKVFGGDLREHCRTVR